MKILAVDTTGASGSIALLEDTRLMAEWTLHSTQTHNRRLLKHIDLFLKELGWTLEQVDAFAVTIGPGSFTGLRIGVTTVKTLAWATGKPLAGISSLDVLSAPFGHAVHPVCTLIDARKGEIYHGLYQPDGKGRIRLLAPYRVDSPERILERVQGPTLFCGDGWPICRELFAKELGDWAIPAADSLHTIRAGHLAELARKRLLEHPGEDPMTCVPLYVRPSEAELHHAQPGS